ERCLRHVCRQPCGRRVETIALRRVEGADDEASDVETGLIPRRGAGLTIRIAAVLAPTVLGTRQVVMAGKTVELGVLRPRRRRRSPPEPIERLAELHELADGPRAHPFVGRRFLPV